MGLGFMRERDVDQRAVGAPRPVGVAADRFARWGVAPVPDPENYTIRFDADGRVNVQADCNLCNGSYQTDGTGLTIGPLACTRAFCPPPSLGNLYTAVLGTTTSFQRTGEQLFINYAGGGAMAFSLAD
jgi:heat shock protein HslJ